jgi:CRISPR/Cas system-associated exonuclease Cas4 (RecB family)
MSYQWIRASEISTYIYCHRAWWLKRKHGVQSQNVQELERGIQHHQRHGRTVWQSLWARRLAYLLLFIVVAYFAYQLVIG